MDCIAVNSITGTNWKLQFGHIRGLQDFVNGMSKYHNLNEYYINHSICYCDKYMQSVIRLGEIKQTRYYHKCAVKHKDNSEIDNCETNAEKITYLYN